MIKKNGILYECRLYKIIIQLQIGMKISLFFKCNALIKVSPWCTNCFCWITVTYILYISNIEIVRYFQKDFLKLQASLISKWGYMTLNCFWSQLLINMFYFIFYMWNWLDVPLILQRIPTVIYNCLFKNK